METAHHHLRFYQAQYQPSFSHLDADQAKVDDYLALGVDALNTPNIDPDFFNEGNLFSNEKVHLKSAKVDPLLGGATEDSYHMGSSISNGSTTTLINGNAIFGDLVAPVHQMNTLQMPSTSTSSSYSPQQQLEISSQIININSPEMMSSSSASTSSSSPNNKSSYHTNPTGSYLGNIEDDPTFYSQVAEYEQLAFYGSPEANGYATGSAPNSRSSSISSGSGCEGVINPSNNYDYLLSDCMTSTELNSSINTTTSTSSTSTNSLNSRLAPSPASSHYSSDSASSKTFTNLDAIQQIQQQQQQQQQQIISHNGQLISIKQEPVDTIYQPTVIEEFESGQQQQLYQPMDNSSYTTISAADLAYYCTPQQQQNQQQYNSQQLPSTVNSVLQPQMQQQQPIPSTSSTGRKRNAAAAFSGAASSASSSSSSSSTASATRAAGTTNSTTTSSSSKKPRMTKREKQKMMESDIGKFETENRDLRQSIDLLERQIAFCKRFLSENVAPVIQRQQQNSSSTTVVSANGQQQFTCSPMMIAVSEM